MAFEHGSSMVRCLSRLILIKRIVLHGVLKDRYPEMEIAAESAAEAIEGWSRQCGIDQEPLDKRVIIEALDFDTPEKLVEKTDAVDIHLFPSLFGGGAVGKILIGAALIGLSFIPGLGQIGQVALSSVLFSAGASLVLGGIMQLFLKAPKIDKSEDPEASKYIGNGVNSTAMGTIIGLGGGRMLIGGHWLSLQVNSNDMIYGSFPTSP